MDETVQNYKILAAEEFVKAMDKSIPEEERKEHLAMGVKLNQTYRELAETEHEYNNSVKERKDRNNELIKVGLGSLTNLIGNLGIALLFAYVDTRDDAIPGFGLKERLKNIRFK